MSQTIPPSVIIDVGLGETLLLKNRKTFSTLQLNKMKEKEFTSLVMPLQRQMYALCLSILRDEEDASDCLQEVCTRLWEHRSRLKAMGNPGGYCMVTARRTAIDILRRRASRPLAEGEGPGDFTDTSPTPADTTEARDDLERLTGLMKSLPPKQRQIVELSGVSGLSNQEIEKATGLSGDNVRVMLSRGRKKLRELFEKTR